MEKGIRARLHLPSIPRNQKMMDRAAALFSKGGKTRNPVPYMSGSIEATRKRALAKHPKPRKI